MVVADKADSNGRYWWASVGDAARPTFTAVVTNWSLAAVFLRTGASCTDRVSIFPIFHGKTACNYGLMDCRSFGDWETAGTTSSQTAPSSPASTRSAR